MLRSSSNFGAATITVTGSCHATAQRPHPRRLRDASPLHVNARGDIISSAWGLPSVLQDSVYYTPVNVEDADFSSQQYMHISTNASVLVYILWPSLQDPPSWLRNRFQLVKGTQLKVSWSFAFKQRALLNLSNKRQAFENQTLQVWQLLKVLPQGTGMSLPGPGLPVHTTSLPMYGYLLAFKPATMDLTANAANLAAKLLASKDTNPLTCSLQQLQASLEDGSLSLEQLPPNAANGLLYRVMAEGEPELLLLLMEKGLGQQATPPALQDLLQYACNERQLQLMELTLATGTPELSKSMLDWWVRELTSTASGYDVERQLADYCLARRNPLSAVAAIELALWKLQAGGLDDSSNQSITALLALKFGAVKHTLLQMLLDRDAQQQAAAALLGHQGNDASPAAGALQQYYSPASRNGLQQVITNCLESNDSAAVSIHDTSPFHGALRINDTHLVNLPEVTAFTQQLWLGLELQQLWGAAGSRRIGARRVSTRKLSSSTTAVSAWKQAGRTATLAAKFKAAGSHQEDAHAEGEKASPKGAEAVAAVTAAARAGFAQDAGPPLRDPSVGYELLQNFGLAPRGTEDGLGLLASHLAHIVLLAPRAFYDSPRGQWLMHCCTEALFLISYQMLVTNVSNRGQDLLLFLLVIGNLVQVLMQYVMKYRGSIRRYLSSHWTKVDVVVHLGMLVVAGDVLMAEFGIMEHQQWVGDVAAALAIPVWARALGIIVPANARLGALLYTLGRMVEEAYSMGLIIGVLLLGFSTTLYADYHTRMGNYATFVGSVRMVFGVMAGDLHLQDFDEASGGDAFYAAFGQVVTMLFIVLVNILLMSLLIAVINHIYSPDKVAKQTTVMFANAASNYAWQAEHGYALPPFNTLQLLLWWVPKRWRARVPHQACLSLWLPPVDGYSSKKGPQRCRALVPTGPAELSYLLFLLTLYPLIGLMAASLLFLRIPVGVAHFLSSGYKQWVAGDTRFGRGKHKGQRQSRDSRSSLDLAPRGPSIDWGAAKFAGVVSAAQAARMRALVSMNRRMQQQVAPEELSWRQRALHRAGRDSCIALQGVNQVLTWVTAAVTAVVLQLVLVTLLLVALAYSLAAQIVWTAWCVLFWWTLPQDMVTDQPPLLKRAADFWSAADLESSFRQHKVLHRHSTSRGSHSEVNSANGQAPPSDMPAGAGAKSTRWSAPGSVEAWQVPVQPAGGVTAVPAAFSRQVSIGGATAVPGGLGGMSQRRLNSGPQPPSVPVYAECPSLAETARSVSARRPSVIATAGSGGALMSPDSSGNSGSNGNRSSNALPAAWLVNHLSSILYSNDPPAPLAPGTDLVSSSNSSITSGSNSSQNFSGPVSSTSGPPTYSAAAVSGSEHSPAAAETLSGTMAAHGTVAATATAAASVGTASSRQPLWQSMEGGMPLAPPGGFVAPTSMRQSSSAARTMAALPGVQ